MMILELRLSLWGVFTSVSSLSLQYPKIVYLPQAVKSLLFPNQKRTQGPRILKRNPIFNKKGTKWGPYVNDIKRGIKLFFLPKKTLTYLLQQAVPAN